LSFSLWEEAADLFLFVVYVSMHFWVSTVWNWNFLFLTGVGLK